MSDRESQLVELIQTEQRVMALLRAVRSLRLDQWCIAAGTIRNLVWDHLHGFTTPTLPSDVDVLFFDSQNTSESFEQELERQLGAIVSNVEWEVVNQATINEYTGDPTPYVSIRDAMSRWAELVTAVGARLHDDNRICSNDSVVEQPISALFSSALVLSERRSTLSKRALTSTHRASGCGHCLVSR